MKKICEQRVPTARTWHGVTVAAALLQSLPALLCAQQDTISSQRQLDDVTVSARGGATRSRVRVDNVELIGAQQLVRAACCNLGESFVTNPSVDVNYSDAATGARQIKLLGLSGTYVQMLTENVPNLRGASIPYALSFVPGPWMQSIQVSKGASSVRNGYESTTGQINIEYQKPQGADGVRANAYLDSHLKYELNLDASRHITDRLSVSLLAHWEDLQRAHDGNGDAFADMPRQRQWNVMPRVAYVSPRWISQLSVRALRDERESGQIGSHAAHLANPYEVEVKTDRYEMQWKNGFPLGDEHNTSVALMLHGSWHDAWQRFGASQLDARQDNGYAQLMLESDVTEQQNLSVGLTVNYDMFDTRLKHASAGEMQERDTETTTGAYAQYTLKVGDVWSVMAGVRADYSNLYDYWFVTPRFHLKYQPAQWLTLRASAGKGYRTPHALAENSPLLITGRVPMMHYELDSEQPRQEEAWNYGAQAALTLPVGDRTLEVNVEYYYTTFSEQLVVGHEDYAAPAVVVGGRPDAYAYPSPLRQVHAVTFGNLLPGGCSYSHTLQVDASCEVMEGLSLLAAFRLNDARTSYYKMVHEGYQSGFVPELHRRPLTPAYKGLFTASYKTPLELWQLDVTAQLNGDGELYDHTAYPAFWQLQAQLTREFRFGSIYVGGENLTGFRQKQPIRHADDPWSSAFDATQVWGPTEGAMFYAGVRIRVGKN